MRQKVFKILSYPNSLILIHHENSPMRPSVNSLKKDLITYLKTQSWILKDSETRQSSWRFKKKKIIRTVTQHNLLKQIQRETSISYNLLIFKPFGLFSLEMKGQRRSD